MQSPSIKKREPTHEVDIGLVAQHSSCSFQQTDMESLLEASPNRKNEKKKMETVRAKSRISHFLCRSLLILKLTDKDFVTI